MTHESNSETKFSYDLQLPSGKKAQFKKMEGEYKMAYYNGPVTSPYACTSESGESSKRMLITLHDVIVPDQLFPVQDSKGTAIITSNRPNKDSGEPDKWTYDNIIFEKIVPVNGYENDKFTRIEISYTDETHHNSFFN